MKKSQQFFHRFAYNPGGTLYQRNHLVEETLARLLRNQDVYKRQGFLRMVLMMVNLFTLIKYAGNVEATEKITPCLLYTSSKVISRPW